MIRTVSGIIYLVLVIGSLFLGKYVYGIVFLLTGIMALVEFYDITGYSGSKHFVLTGIFASAGIFILSFLVASGLTGYRFLALASVIPIIMLIMALYSSKPDVIKTMAMLVLGILYVMFPLSLMNYLVFPASNNFEYTHRILLGILALVWINDTGAYLTGTLFGRHKLFPRISPKKSWEGVLGGTILTLLPAWWMDNLMGILNGFHWLCLASIVVVFGVYGDLTESLIKRNAGMKDSGTIMPGHGGALDRIDSILFVIPLSFIYLIINGL